VTSSAYSITLTFFLKKKQSVWETMVTSSTDSIDDISAFVAFMP
jgi:hypothetical protein